MMWFTKIAAQVVNDAFTSREGNEYDLVFYSGHFLFQIQVPTLYTTTFLTSTTLLQDIKSTVASTVQIAMTKTLAACPSCTP
jgi:hypothetical protein